MTLLFWRRRTMRDFAEAIRPELESLPTPEPRKELLARILASREAGARIILPEVTAEPSRLRLQFLTVAAIAAALLFVVIPRGPAGDGSTDESLASTAFFGHAAFAQTPSRPDAPELPPVETARASSIHPIDVEFSRRIHDTQGALMSELRGNVSLTADAVEGLPAWRITSIETDTIASQRRTDAETLYVARSDLRLLRRAVHVSPYRRFARINIQQRFDGDSVTGRMTTDGPSIGPGRAIARRLRPEFGPYMSNAFASLYLMAAPLDRDWRGSASMLGWAVIPNDVFVPIELRVEGAERIKVPAGTFDCWRISIRHAGKQISFWARKSDGLGVRVYDESEASTKGTREVVLLRVR